MPILTQIAALALGIVGYVALVTYSRWGWWLFGAGCLGGSLLGFVVGYGGWATGPSMAATFVAAADMAILGLPVGRRHPASRVLAWCFAAWGAVGLFVMGAYLLVPFALAGLSLTRDFVKRGPAAEKSATSLARLEAILHETVSVRSVADLEHFPSKTHSEFVDAVRQGRIEILAKYDPQALSVLATRGEHILHNLLTSSPFVVMAADVALAVAFRNWWVLLGVPLAYLGVFLSVPPFMRAYGIWLNRGLAVLLIYLLYDGHPTSAALVGSYLVPNFLAHTARHHCRVIFLNRIARSELVLVWLFLNGSVVPVQGNSHESETVPERNRVRE